jgi:hypothetical protein
LVAAPPLVAPAAAAPVASAGVCCDGSGEVGLDELLVPVAVVPVTVTWSKALPRYCGSMTICDRVAEISWPSCAGRETFTLTVHRLAMVPSWSASIS